MSFRGRLFGICKCRISFEFYSSSYNHRTVWYLSKRDYSVVSFSRNMTSSDTSADPFVIDKSAYTVIREGKADVLFPNSHDVFYNPVQEFNRDISVAAIKLFCKEYGSPGTAENNDLESSLVAGKSYQNGITILEGLAASGLRSIRYALEIPGIKKIIANDLSKEAVESIERNIKFNNVQSLVEASKDDAALLLYKNRNFNKQFDVVDLDPYGSPAAFLDGAVQAVKDGGLLMVTCTDLAILCGNHSETCRAKYGAMSIKAKCCHEMALRIVLQAIESHANRYGRYIVPMLSISVDFYLRIFLRVYTSPKNVKNSASKLSMVYHCKGCQVNSFQLLGKVEQKNNRLKHSLATGPPVDRSCQHCGHSHVVGGPIWTSKIHDGIFVKKLRESVEEESDLYATSRRMVGILSVANEELEDVPLFYITDGLSCTVSVPPPSRKELWSALLNAGYKVSASHAAKSSIKTDAPAEVIWDIMRAWRKKVGETMKLKDLDPSSPGFRIMSTESRTNVSFESHKDAEPESVTKGLMRYQVNPEPNWGPKARAKSSLKYELMDEKRKRRQGKRKKQGNGDVQETVQKRLQSERHEVAENSCNE